MHFLYHRVPKDLEGETLYPLNGLQRVLPQVFARERAKYRGRETLLQVRIPMLDCLWNDVLHLTAVPPTDIKAALIAAGRSPDIAMRYFQIDPAVLIHEHAIIYLSTNESLQDITPNHFAPYDPETISQYAAIPEATTKYYREMFTTGKKPLLYHRIPHILYRGTLTTTDLPIVTA